MQNTTYHGGERWQALERARLLSELNRHREAIAVLQKLVARAPDDDHVLCLLAGEHLELDQPAEALAWADRAVACAPDEEWGHRLRSIALIQSDHEAALISAREAVARMPESRQTLQNLAHALLANGFWREAWQTAERLHALYPDDAATQDTLASVAFAHEWWGDAERLSRESLKRFAASPSAHYNLGAVLFNRKQYGESAESFARATELDPTRAATRNMAACAAGAHLDSTLGPGVPYKLTAGMILFPLFLWLILLFSVFDGATAGAEPVIGIAALASLFSVFLLFRRYQRWRALSPAVRRLYLITRWSSLRNVAPREFDALIARQTA